MNWAKILSTIGISVLGIHLVGCGADDGNILQPPVCNAIALAPSVRIIDKVPLIFTPNIAVYFADNKVLDDCEAGYSSSFAYAYRFQLRSAEDIVEIQPGFEWMQNNKTANIEIRNCDDNSVLFKQSDVDLNIQAASTCGLTGFYGFVEL